MVSDGAKVVISGISGVFPESQNVNEFKENLFAKKDLTTLDHRRWNIDLFKGNSKLGKIKDLSKFDHSFFRVHRNHANSITPASRILLEQTYEAIVDAGYNPEELKKTKTGVYIAIGYNDWEDTAAFSQTVINEDFAAGLSRSIIANRISYWLDVYGPSYTIDSACSASLSAFDRAFRDISDGICDSALVGGFSLCFLNKLNAAYGKSGVLSMTGCCRPFDEDADGFVRGEAVVMLFLQKEQNARRIYAHVISTYGNCDGYKEEGLTSPSGESHIRLYEEVYKGIGVSPKSVSYIEAHGTATRVGDIIEVNAIEKFFCKDRKDVLKIGSVKSNMGHGEACAGLCSLVKIIIAFETGLIPPTINVKKLNPKIPALHNGKIEVVTEATPCIGEYFAVNAFGIGGANAHVLLSPHNGQISKKTMENSTFPQLVLLSGRTEEAIDVLTADLENNHSDAEYIHLMREIYRYTIDGHLYRGYFLKSQGKEPIKSSQHIREEKRPLWFVFPGMGCQWPGMGKDLLKIPVFAESIQKSHKLLESRGLDLMKIITEDDPHIFDNALHSFVGIAAVQVALIDVMNAMEIIPDGIIGHSVGEMICAYADGCLTAEQAVLGACYRGMTTMASELGSGSMAAIGQQYDELKKSLPPEIDIACHNTKDNYTISGPADAVNEYVKSMQSKNILARAVNAAGIAFHSRYIAPAGPKLLSNLKKIITNPQLRSKKWICTSALQSDWDTDKVKYASAEYYTNNLLSPVYFEQGAQNIPKNALVIEIAPHGLLQALLKKSLPSSVENMSISSKNHEDNVTFFLSTIGKLYTNGINPKITNLYPPPKFPVSRGTPMIAPLVKWKHDEEWFIPRADENSIKSGERTFIIDVKSEEYEYLMGHVIDGRNIFPGVEYLNLIWESMAIMHGKSQLETAVVFEDVRFLRATYILGREIRFHTSIQQATGHFEITEQDAAVVKGRVYLQENTDDGEDSISDWNTFSANELPLKTKDVYKVLRLKGFQYQDSFRNLLSANSKGTFGKLGWNNNFVTFMDSLAHLKIMTQDTSELSLPTFIRKAIIDPVKHYEVLDTLDKENPEFPAYHDKSCSALQSGGIQIHGLKFNAISRKKEIKDVVLEKYQFVPNFSNEKLELDTAIRLCANIVIENLQVLKVRSVELLNGQIKTEEMISIHIQNALRDLPLIQADVSVLIENESGIQLENLNEIKLIKGNLQPTKNLSIIIISNILGKKNQLAQLFDALRENAFIMTRERALDEKSLKNLGLEVCFCRNVGCEYIILLRKKQTANCERNPIVFKINNFSYSWISKMQKSIDEVDVERNQKVVLYAEKDSYNGILGFFNCIRKEYDSDIFRCFFIMDKDAPEFSLDNPFYKTQFLKNLSHNVYKNGKWGSYRHLPIEPSQKQKCYHAFAKVAVRGDLSTLKWVEGPIRPINYKNDDSLIHVYYSALNFRDIVLATGKVSVMDIFKSRIEEEETLGLEVSGKNENGERYMAVTWTNSVSSLVFGDPFMRWKVPDYMSLEEAATIPVVYATAILALFNHGQIRKGQSVLIHAGSGGVGLACIHICIHYECNIFTTVGTPEKVDFIRKTFPQIPKTQIGNSRDTSFEKMVMRQTNGKGVDLLVNSLSEEKFHASLRCVAQRGKFLEIGKYDMSKNTLIDSYNFLKAVSFHSVMFDCFMQASAEDKLLFRDRMQELIDSGVVKPLQSTVFQPEDTESALRYMAAGKHIGKVLIKIREEESNTKCKSSPFFVDAYPRVMCEKNQVYIITGGLGGFGLELADWLILRGARKMILTSRTGIRNGYQLFKIQQWKSYGVVVSIDTNDITTEIGVKRLLTFANSLGPVTGIFNLSVLLRDKPFEAQTTDSFVESAGPKAIATIHLDKLSRIMCPDLEHFVVFSSVSCGRGNAAQTNYGMFNSVMERICESRKEANLPALAIQWGAVGDVGLVADMAEENKTVVIGGTLQQKINSCLETLDLFMKQPNPIVASMIVAEKYRPYSNIVNVAANVLGIKDLKSISLNWTLPQLGMDSMMATELKQILESEFEMFLTQKDIKNLTFSKLLAMAEDNEQKYSVKTDKGTNELQKINQFTEEEIKLPIIRIPSMIDIASMEEVDVQNIQTVFIFPGQEGYSKLLEVLGNSFAAQLLCLQYFSGAPHENFCCLAQKLLPHITNRLSSNQKFQIIAYSLGCSIVIEVVKLLEQLGYSGKICFIDGAPLYNQSIFAEYYSNSCFTENETEAKVMMTCLKALIPNAIYEELYNDLLSRNSWESKISLVSLMLSKYVDSKVTMDMILNYIFSLTWLPKLDVGIDQPLRSKAVLIRSSDGRQDIPDDYGLSKYFEAPVQVHRVEADHNNIFKNKKTIKIILKNFE